MKRNSIIAALLMLAGLTAAAQENPSGSVNYALPQTVISLDVEAVMESFHAGPYARYAEKYLGIEAEQEDKVSCQVSNIKLTPRIEADPSARYISVIPANAGSTFLQMTAQGLISTSDGSFGDESVWRFPALNSSNFSAKGISSNLTTEASTLYRNARDEGFSKTIVSQSMVVEKSLEQKAAEAADMVLKLRKTRIQIITGDTDATYSGEAMASAIEEMTKLEQEYLSLFVGYSDYQTQKVQFDVVPKDDSRNHVYVAFRLSDTDGLVPADNMSGKPYLLDIVDEGLERPVGDGKGGSAKGLLYYRIPSICNVKLTDGVNLILQTRIPIYQFGAIGSYPLGK